MSAITCRECGASTADEDEFEVIELIKSTYTSSIVGLTEDGGIVRGIGAQGPIESTYQNEIACMSCGHQWKTSRRVADIEAAS